MKTLLLCLLALSFNAISAVKNTFTYTDVSLENLNCRTLSADLIRGRERIKLAVGSEFCNELKRVSINSAGYLSEKSITVDSSNKIVEIKIDRGENTIQTLADQ
jgi:hypothetical protein